MTSLAQNEWPRIHLSLSSFCSQTKTLLLGLAMLSLVVIVTEIFPPLTNAIEYQQAAIAEGQAWRLITGHFTHWNFDHLFWDLSAFVGLAFVCLKRSIARTLVCILGSSLAISVGLWFYQPEIITYRGLSGIDSALFVLLAVGVLRDACAERDWLLGTAALLGLGGFVTKLGFEVLTGDILFVDSYVGEFVPLASAHIVGGVVGGLFGALPVSQKD